MNMKAAFMRLFLNLASPLLSLFPFIVNDLKQLIKAGLDGHKKVILH